MGAPKARRAPRAPSRKAKGKAATARRGAARKPAASGPVVAEPAIASATARASASLKTTLFEESTLVAEQALQAAEQIHLLLHEDDPDEDDEDDDPGPGAGTAPPRSRARPAPAILPPKTPAGPQTGMPATRSPAPRPEEARPGAPPAAGDATARPGADRAASTDVAAAAHLFPRNLRTVYPVAVRAEGVWIHDSAGKRYLDGCGGAVVCAIGHGVPQVAQAMAEQARRLAFAHSSQFVTREAMGLASRIAALAPGDMKRTGRVYLVSGGSEAIETAIKLARQYHVDSGRPARRKIIARWQSYHGSTMGALAVTGNVARRETYEPLFANMPHIPPCYCYRCPYGLKYPSCRIACIEELEHLIHQEGPDTVAAFLAEPIVGATLGAVPAVDGYWQRAREICSKHGVLLIADEVMTGVGRTGKNFAVDHYGVVPDMIVAGKGLSAGYAPLGAVIARGFIADALRDGRGYFEHGFTYSANPLSAAVGNAVLDYIAANHLIARARRMGRTLGRRLGDLARRHPIVGEVRGAGMMWGLELVRDRRSREPWPPSLKAGRRLYDACMEEGLILYPGSGTREGRDGDHVLIAPAFTITGAEMADLLARLDRGLVKVAASLRKG